MRLVLVIVVIFFQNAYFTIDYFELAKHYAPIHLQNICIKGKNSLQGKSDYLSAMNYDGDWDACNNWENLSKFNITPIVYYSVIESEGFYFVQYQFFHARDWTRTPFTKIGQHENDLEGVTCFIKKDTTKFGKLIGGITIFHNSFLIYNAQNMYYRYKNNQNNSNNMNEHSNVYTAQQSKGHGCKAFNDIRISRNSIIYIPEGAQLEREYLLRLKQYRIETYSLVTIFEINELWDQRTNVLFFDSDNTIKGNNGKGANPPWLWQSNALKRKFEAGIIATNPIKLVYLFGESVEENEYIFNPYIDN